MTEFTPRKFSDGISANGRSLTLPHFWEPRAPLTQFWCMTVPARTRRPVQRHLCARDGCYHLGTLSGCWGNAPPGTPNPSPPACHNSLLLSDEVFPSFMSAFSQNWPSLHVSNIFTSQGTFQKSGLRCRITVVCEPDSNEQQLLT